MVQIGLILTLLALGYFFGSFNERKHFASIRKREKGFQKLPAINFKRVPAEFGDVATSELVIGSTVVSLDYFKRFLGAIKNLTGGRLNSYESLLDRARREAVLRMKESAQNAELIINIRIETSAIGQSSNKKGSVGSIEVVAYGTALSFK